MSNFKINKLLDLEWYKNTKKSNWSGAQDHVIKKRKDGEMVIKSWTKKHGQMWTSCKPEMAKKLLNKNRGIYEYIINIWINSI